eukprot:COSAG01_NODE_829_length_13273_cov_7.729695_6_plen_82_part_00
MLFSFPVEVFASSDGCHRPYFAGECLGEAAGGWGATTYLLSTTPSGSLHVPADRAKIGQFHQNLVGGWPTRKITTSDNPIF